MGPAAFVALGVAYSVLAAMRERADPGDLAGCYQKVLVVTPQNAALFQTLAREAGIDIGDSACAPTIRCIVGSSIKALQLSDALIRRGVSVDPILFPAVTEDKARLRFFVTSCHSEEQIRFIVRVLAEELELLNAGS